MNSQDKRSRVMAEHELVEKVARALAREARVSEMEASGFNGIHLSEYVESCWRNHADRARAAIAALQPQDAATHCFECDTELHGPYCPKCSQGDGLAELRVGDFVMRTSPNGIWIGRTGGEGGEFATEHVERAIAQFYREQF
jgi:hypothetical protein